MRRTEVSCVSLVLVQVLLFMHVCAVSFTFLYPHMHVQYDLTESNCKGQGSGVSVVRPSSKALDQIQVPSSSEGQDGVVGLPGPAQLDVVEAGLVEHQGVLGRAALAAHRLHQHVEGEELTHDGPLPVLKQHGLHQQNAATCHKGTRGFVEVCQRRSGLQ